MGRVVRTILAAVHDPGGTQALLPVLARLRDSADCRLHVVATPLSAPSLEKRRIPCTVESPTVAPELAAAWFARLSPDCLITGTSWASNLEQQLRNQAARTKTPSVVVLDFWTNYALRWQGAEYALAGLPDWVCVPDRGAALEMAALGFPAGKLVATGQPFLEELFSASAQDGGQGDAGHYLFFSQPSVEDGRTITREDHLAAVTAALRGLAAASGRPLRLGVRPHPKESDVGRLTRVAERESSPLCQVELTPANQPLRDSVLAAGCVIGYFTMALFEARALGRKAVSLDAQPMGAALRQALAAAGVVSAPLDTAALGEALAALEPPGRPEGFHRGAVQDILHVVEKKTRRGPLSPIGHHVATAHTQEVSV